MAETAPGEEEIVKISEGTDCSSILRLLENQLPFNISRSNHNLDGRSIYAEGAVDAVILLAKKRLVVSASVNESNVMADTTSVVAEKNKGCNRKDELRKLVMEHLVAMGYNAAICKSKWEKSPSFPPVPPRQFP